MVQAAEEVASGLADRINEPMQPGCTESGGEDVEEELLSILRMYRDVFLPVHLELMPHRRLVEDVRPLFLADAKLLPSAEGGQCVAFGTGQSRILGLQDHQ